MTSDAPEFARDSPGRLRARLALSPGSPSHWLASPARRASGRASRHPTTRRSCTSSTASDSGRGLATSSASGAWAWRRGSTGSCDPDRVADDAVDARLAGMPTLRMTSTADRRGVPAAAAGATPAAATRGRARAGHGRASRARGGDRARPAAPAGTVAENWSRRKCCAPSTASGSCRKCSPISGSTISTSSQTRASPESISRRTSATPSGRTCWAASAICWVRPRRARRCSSISTTPAAPTRRLRRRPGPTSTGSQRAGRRRGTRQAGREITPEMMEQVRQNIPTGINENYARELLELHTLGVDGGFTQQDIVNVARALTGWTIGRPRSAAGRTVLVQPEDARHGRQGRAGAEDQGRRHRGRRARAGSAGAAPVHCAVHRHQAGAPLRRRRAARGARGTVRRLAFARPTATCARWCA